MSEEAFPWSTRLQQVAGGIKKGASTLATKYYTQRSFYDPARPGALAEDLRPGEKMLGRGVEREIVAVERVYRPVGTYNLAVAENRTFFADGVWVHNCGPLAPKFIGPGYRASTLAPSPGQIAMYQRQLDQFGPEKLYKSMTSLLERLAEHEAKLPNLQYKSSVHKEIDNFRQEINAIHDVLAGAP
ncbi:MAG TPA: Hint domain-containing protein [Phycisphaerales bacterium]|nr:Hint domain-containing protein [Phycisphaerales bacterium]